MSAEDIAAMEAERQAAENMELPDGDEDF